MLLEQKNGAFGVFVCVFSLSLCLSLPLSLSLTFTLPFSFVSVCGLLELEEQDHVEEQGAEIAQLEA